MIRHVITWKLVEQHPDRRAEVAAELAERLNALPAAIPEILSFEVGVNEVHADVNWHVTLVSTFDSFEALEVYSAHPVHQELVAWVRPRVSERAGVDFTV